MDAVIDHGLAQPTEFLATAELGSEIAYGYGRTTTHIFRLRWPPQPPNGAWDPLKSANLGTRNSSPSRQATRHRRAWRALGAIRSVHLGERGDPAGHQNDPSRRGRRGRRRHPLRAGLPAAREERLRALGSWGDGPRGRQDRIDLRLEPAADGSARQPPEIVRIGARQLSDREPGIAAEVEDRARASARSHRLRRRAPPGGPLLRPGLPGLCHRRRGGGLPTTIVLSPRLPVAQGLPRDVEHRHLRVGAARVRVMFPRQGPVRGSDHLGLSLGDHLQQAV